MINIETSSGNPGSCLFKLGDDYDFDIFWTQSFCLLFLMSPAERDCSKTQPRGKFNVFYGFLDTIPRNPEPFVGSVTTVLVAEQWTFSGAFSISTHPNRFAGSRFGSQPPCFKSSKLTWMASRLLQLGTLRPARGLQCQHASGRRHGGWLSVFSPKTGAWIEIIYEMIYDDFRVSNGKKCKIITHLISKP